ncbi:MAG: sulfatase [Kiritimatiellaceae bacterium]|nr:sulfatase [Kiritimatiellaceae bacterium]
MNRKVILGSLGLTAAFTAAAGGEGSMKTEKRPPNFVIIFLDDSGWGDFKPFGNPSYETPNVKQLADEGCRYSQFYVPQAVCSASRAALLTGCDPGRTHVFGAIGPRQRGLSPEFATLSEVLKAKGYSTAAFGKWHIGDEPDTRPHARGFDESCGLMYSNDMWRHHPHMRWFDNFPLQFWENGTIAIEDIEPEDQNHLTKWYTEHAVDFINRHREAPFFLYVPHSMPHVPLACSKEFRGKSGAGLYGDVIMEIDWSVGQIMHALKDNGLDENTLVMFTSDNGPWLTYGNHAGVTPFREGKATSFDGGTRVACTVKYPGVIKAGSVSDKAWCSIDVLPTLVGLAGAELPKNPIDGKDVLDLITGKPGAKNPHVYYPISFDTEMQGVISGDGQWKLLLPHEYRKLIKPGTDGKSGESRQEPIELSLFDMKNDPYETTNVISRYPEIAERLRVLAEDHRDKFYKKKPASTDAKTD